MAEQLITIRRLGHQIRSLNGPSDKRKTETAREANMLLSKDIVLILLFYPFQGSLGGSLFISNANIRIEKFEQCPDKLDAPNVFSRTRTSQNALNDISIEGLIYVRQAIVSPATLKVVLTRCESKDAPYTCEYYYTFSTKEFCKLLDMDNMPWTDFWTQTTLPRSCPIPVGNYSMNGAKLSLGNIPDSSILHGYWKIRSSGKSGGKSWHCAIAEFSFGTMGNKRKRNKKQG